MSKVWCLINQNQTHPIGVFKSNSFLKEHCGVGGSALFVLTPPDTQSTYQLDRDSEELLLTYKAPLSFLLLYLIVSMDRSEVGHFANYNLAIRLNLAL
jgi:hypothetical protein